MVYFWLSANESVDIDFDILTSAIGINPTETRKKESYKIKEYARDSWKLSTDYKEEMEVSILFEELVDILSGKENIINELKAKYNLKSGLMIVIQANEDKIPILDLTQKCINFAAKVNTEIHFDHYFYCVNET
jgi:hypothetical protein